MAWIAPRTWVAGEIVTAGMMNNNVRGNFRAIGDPWVAYTPVWSGLTANPTIGNGSLTGAYMQAGQLVHFRIGITMGATSTYGAGQWRLTLPVLPVVFRWTFLGDAVVGGAFPIRGIWDSALGVLTLATPGTTAGGADRTVSATSPGAWATGHTLFLSGTYEAA
jgi:hypothetical protein